MAAALEQLKPDAVLIEGPPEADAIAALAADKEMQPPVALLAHVVDDPARAAFWPFAVFSPEWVALRYAVDHDVPVRFVDLPAAHTFALAEAPPGVPGGTSGEAAGAEDGTGDPIVPLSQSERYVDRASAAGAPAELVEVDGDHFVVIDIESDAWARQLEILDSIA